MTQLFNINNREFIIDFSIIDQLTPIEVSRFEESVRISLSQLDDVDKARKVIASVNHKVKINSVIEKNT